MYLNRLRKVLVGDAARRDVDDATANVCLSFGCEEEVSTVATVIDSYKLAETTFTPNYLFVQNTIRVQAADYKAIDQTTYHERLSSA